MRRSRRRWAVGLAVVAATLVADRTVLAPDAGAAPAEVPEVEEAAAAEDPPGAFDAVTVRVAALHAKVAPEIVDHSAAAPEPGESLSGSVVDPAGHPVSGAHVTVHDAAGAALVRTDAGANGEFVVRAPLDAIVEARHAPWSPGRVRIDAAAQTAGHLVIRLGEPKDASPPPGAIGGSVRDWVGNPIEGVAVVAQAEDPTVEAPRPNEAATGRLAGRSVTGKDGRFVVVNLEAGSYTVAAQAAGGLGPASVEHVRTGRRDVELRLIGDGLLASAVSSDGRDHPSWGALPPGSHGGGGAPGNGTPLPPDNRTQLVPPAVTGTPQHGTFGGFVPLPEAPRPTPGDNPPPPPEPGPAHGAHLTGRVLADEDGTPIANARVTLQTPLDGPPGPPLVTATTDQAGAFSFDFVEAGRRALAVSAADREGRVVAGIELPVDGNVGPVTVSLTAVPLWLWGPAGTTSIGAALLANRDALLVVDVQSGGGAAESGLIENDRIIAIEGLAVGQIGPAAARQLLLGPAGTPVRLGVNRAALRVTAELIVFRLRFTGNQP